MSVSIDFIGLFLFIAGLIVGLGAVTVIDLHGFLGRRSPYWTEATTRTHKVTKPLIWLGTILAMIGASITYRTTGMTGIGLWQTIVFVLLILNGLFLTFKVSPYLLRREKEGRAAELLPSLWQHAITASFIVSFTGWWGTVLLLVWFLQS